LISRLVAVGLVAGAVGAAIAQPSRDPALEPVLAKMGAYISNYGDKASLIVAVEKYTQTVMFEGAQAPGQPRRLVAEFAIVKTSDGSGWMGFRDVVEVDGKTLSDRRDRLVSLFTSTSTTDVNEVTRIANESARFNVGPISRNFNVPTSALFFFLPEHLSRFQFTRKGVKKIDGVETWEVAFKETRTPTFIMTRGGVDVPVSGALWINPGDGTVVRTRMQMSNFADQMTSPVQSAPVQRPEMDPSRPQGARPAALPTFDLQRIDSSADIEVTYRKPPGVGLWLPAVMEESYHGPITLKVNPSPGRSTTRATYSDFKQFATAGTLVVPKQ
jgi:hypothetical protein